MSHTQPWFARNGKFVSWSLLAAGAALIALPAVADPVENLAKRLTTLRGEVEALNYEVNEVQSTARDEVRALQRTKAELDSELKREQTRVQKIQQMIRERGKKAEEANEAETALKPVFEQSVKSVRAYVEMTLPFKMKERLNAVDGIEEQYTKGLLSPARALSRLWSFLEDEFRLSRENRLDKQTILVDGAEELVEVVRLGSVMLFFKTEAGDFGRALRKDGAWVFERYQDPREKQEVAYLFENFKKQIRGGYFVIPNAITAEEK